MPAREAWRAERNRSMGLDPGDELVHALFGPEMVDIYLGQEAIKRGGALGVYDSARRNAELEAEGIVAEVLFPDFQNSNEPPWGAAFPYPDTTPELRLAGARAFNRWLADFCAELPGRRAGVAVVQPHDIETAVDEVRWVRESGLASAMLPTGDLGPPRLPRPLLRSAVGRMRRARPAGDLPFRAVHRGRGTGPTRCGSPSSSSCGGPGVHSGS